MFRRVGNFDVAIPAQPPCDRIDNVTALACGSLAFRNAIIAMPRIWMGQVRGGGIEFD
jgi:hypothetical protein